MTDLMGDLRWILDALPIAIWVGNVPDGSVAYVNREFERVLLMPSVASSRIDDVPRTYGVVGRDRQPYPTQKLPFSRVVAERSPVVVDDMILQRPSGDIAIRAFGAPVFRADGSLSHAIVAFFDITAEASAQRERALVQDRLSFVCNHAPIAMWATDLEGKVTLSEGAGLASLGVKPGQLVGQNLFDLYSGHPTIPGHIRRALAGESFWYTAQDGEAIFESWLTPLRDESGQMIGLAGFSNDVTAIRKLQNTVIQNDRVNAMGTLAASVAHEINNPLTYVIARGDEVHHELEALEHLVSQEAPALSAIRASVARIREGLAPVRAGTAQIATITRDLRSFNRPDDSTLAPVDLRAVVDSVLKLVRKEVEARASLVLELNETPPVMGNETRLLQVVLNLIVNALQALPTDARSRKEISVRTHVKGSHVVIDVGDSGAGIPLADRERIFDPFYTTKEIGKGTGLGLFVCRNIVRGLSGDVVVLDAPDGGALFRVTLPAGPAGQMSTPATRGASRASTVGRHIVLIDDDSRVLDALSSLLAHAGFRVTPLGDPRTAIEVLLVTEDVDLIYCDLMMKGMTGMELAAELAAKDPGKARKLVFMTGGAFTPKAQEFLARNSERAVDKPFDIVHETRRRLT